MATRVTSKLISLANLDAISIITNSTPSSFDSLSIMVSAVPVGVGGIELERLTGGFVQGHLLLVGFKPPQAPPI